MIISNGVGAGAWKLLICTDHSIVFFKQLSIESHSNINMFRGHIIESHFSFHFLITFSLKRYAHGSLDELEGWPTYVIAVLKQIINDVIVVPVALSAPRCVLVSVTADWKTNTPSFQN